MDALRIVMSSHNCTYDLKPLQEEAIGHLLKGKDVFCVLPTGYGKSDIFGWFPAVQTKVIIVHFNAN